MLEISWDTVQSVTLGVLGAGWIALAGFLGGMRASHAGLVARVDKLEREQITPSKFDKLIRSIGTIKRIVYLLAEKAEIENGALHEDDA